ncbi:hypothetical protein M0R04_06325 [Candidatus Dojkabacteria bacterium]|jgi:hypothetical protein|nr:hypothetical protein [Candidatus Dojkabacteria bacterium]
MPKLNYEKEQVIQQEKTNLWLIVNTAFTILTGLATVALAFADYFKK